MPWISNAMQTAIAGALFGLTMAAIALATTYLHAWQLEIASQYQEGHQEITKAISDAKPPTPATSPTQDPTMAEILRQIRSQNDKMAEDIKVLKSPK
jgi:hypothetical protein